jgi:hypothetical protein
MGVMTTKSVLSKHKIAIIVASIVLLLLFGVVAHALSDKTIIFGETGQMYEMNDGDVLILKQPDGSELIVESFDSTNDASVPVPSAAVTESPK